MLPFLQKKKNSAVTVYQSDSNGNKELSEAEPVQDLMACAEALISAVHNKDAAAVAEVLKSLLK